MRPNERWLWLGETLGAEEAGVSVWRCYPGCYFLVLGRVRLGPFGDETILRAYRIARTPTIDGCERGPSRLGFQALEAPARLGRWPANAVLVDEHELPCSVTNYEADALRPVVGCCTVDDAVPDVAWADVTASPPGGPAAPLAGRLRATWNAHPAHSQVLATAASLSGGFSIVDVPAGA